MTGCTGLGGEPEIIRTLPPPDELAVSLPAEPPDVALGAVLFAQRCTQCHGVGGAGDGELAVTGRLVVDGETIDPGNFTDPAQIAGKTPADYYQIITNGNLARIMPPWGEEFTEAERWALAAYTYTLHHTPDLLAAGAGLIDTSGELGNLTNPAVMLGFSDAEIGLLIDAGAIPVTTVALTEEDRDAAIAYARVLSLANVALTDAAAAEAVNGRVFGQVRVVSAGAVLPDGQPVTLHIFDDQLAEQRIDGVVDADGWFEFLNVSISPGQLYFVSLIYDDRRFASAFVRGDPSNPDVELPVIAYGVTSDASVIEIIGMAIQVLPVGDYLQFNQAVSFRNVSDEVYSSDTPVDEDRFASVTLDLPVGAVVTLTESDPRFVIDEALAQVSDTRGVLPGEQHFIRLNYIVPYEDGAIIDFPARYAFNGPLRVLIEGDAIVALGENVPPLGSEVVDEVEYNLFGADLKLPAQSTIRFELRGSAPGIGTSQQADVVTGDRLIPILIGVGALLVVMMGGVVYWNVRSGGRATGQSRQVMRDSLQRQIAHLEALHERGAINHDLYHQRRQQLMARLDALERERGE